MNTVEGILHQLQTEYPISMNVLKLIGFIVVLRKIIKLLRGIYRVTLRRRKNLKQRYGQGSWAFITGSSEGIGKGMALAYAKEGFNIVLSARTVSKLEAAKHEITTKYPSVQVEIISIDFKRCIQEGYLEQAFKKMENFDVSIVVNNVGVDVLSFYHDLSPNEIQDLIKINCFPVAMICRHFIPKFLQRTKKTNKKCAIVNTSSIAGEIPMALHNVYSASKAFVEYLTISLANEYKQIDIMSLKPGEVSTPMTENKPVDFMTITAERCAEDMLDNMGYEKTTNGNWNHQLQRWYFMANPEWFFNFIWFNYVGPQFIEERRQSRLKKQKRQN